MPLVTAPKEASASAPSSSPVQVRSTVPRPQVSLRIPQASTARAEALKSRLSAPPAPVAAPRPAGSSARARETNPYQKFNTTPQTPAQAKPQSRLSAQDLGSIEPPPSGAVDSTHLDSSTESVDAAPEATSEALSPQFVALARKEKQLRKAQQELKVAQDAWKQDQGKQITRESLLADPLKVLAEAGITAEKLVELQINQSVPKDPLQQALDKIQQLEDRLNGVTDPENGELAKRDKQAYEDTVQQIESDAQLLVDSNPAYETIKSEGKTSEVKDLILAVFEQEGTLLDVEEACKLVEEKLVQNMLTQYERMDKMAKLKARLRKSTENSTEAMDDQVISAQQSHSRPQLTTLTNSGASTRPLTARDRAIIKAQAAIDAAKR